MFALVTICKFSDRFFFFFCDRSGDSVRFGAVRCGAGRCGAGRRRFFVLADSVRFVQFLSNVCTGERRPCTYALCSSSRDHTNLIFIGVNARYIRFYRSVDHKAARAWCAVPQRALSAESWIFLLFAFFFFSTCLFWGLLA